MKAICILTSALICLDLSSQVITEKEVKSEAKEVTVFLDGAQISSQNKVELSQGVSLLKFINLSPFIDAKSVQVKAAGELTVLSVNHQQNYLSVNAKSRELEDLEKSLETITDKINLESTYLAIIREELAFLEANRVIGGKNETMSVLNFQQSADFYSNRLTALKMKEIERNKTLQDLAKQRDNIARQIQTITSKKEYPGGEIVVKVDARKAGTASFDLSYLVGNASWFPSYDVRAKNINEPVQLIYKANVKQDTKMDWNNVKLRFSTSNPNVSGIAPELQIYYLNYNTLPPSYRMRSNSVTGKVMNANGQALPYATVTVEGSTIATSADAEGNYSISLPNNASQLRFSLAGYGSQVANVSGGVLNVMLNEEDMYLSQAMDKSDARQSKQMRSAAAAEYEVQDEYQGSSLAIPVAQIENQTTVNFEIKTPYTIRSENKNYAVDMESYQLPASYQYYSVPKIDAHAFLIARITDWEKYNLLDGEANLFFEETFVGKTLLDVRSAADTLEISLGRDERITVKREKSLDFTSKQLIGSKKHESRSWKTTVKNNKGQEISMVVLDQVPVSTLEEIEVSVENISGASRNAGTGEIKWEFKLPPAAMKEFVLTYMVKYPKDKNLVIE